MLRYGLYDTENEKSGVVIPSNCERVHMESKHGML